MMGQTTTMQQCQHASLNLFTSKCHYNGNQRNPNQTLYYWRHMGYAIIAVEITGRISRNIRMIPCLKSAWEVAQKQIRHMVCNYTTILMQCTLQPQKEGTPTSQGTSIAALHLLPLQRYLHSMDRFMWSVQSFKILWHQPPKLKLLDFPTTDRQLYS